MGRGEDGRTTGRRGGGTRRGGASWVLREESTTGELQGLDARGDAGTSFFCSSFNEFKCSGEILAQCLFHSSYNSY